MTDAEDAFARLERQVLGARRVSAFIDAVAALQRLYALADDRLRARILALVAPAVGRDLAAAISAAWDQGAQIAAQSMPRPAVPFTATLPRPYVTAARDLERQVAADLRRARTLARNGADPLTALSPVAAARNALTRGVTSLVNAAGNAGARAVADAGGMPVVWIAETNACVTCLGYSGIVAKADKPFPAGLGYGKSSTVAEPTHAPPAHPHCRCTIEVLHEQGYADALRREADRSVLRGFSLESESMATRIDATQRLLDRGVDAPASVVAYAQRAVRAGEFPTRGR